MLMSLGKLSLHRRRSRRHCLMWILSWRHPTSCHPKAPHPPSICPGRYLLLATTGSIDLMTLMGRHSRQTRVCPYITALLGCFIYWFNFAISLAYPFYRFFSFDFFFFYFAHLTRFCILEWISFLFLQRRQNLCAAFAISQQLLSFDP